MSPVKISSLPYSPESKILCKCELIGNLLPTQKPKIKAAQDTNLDTVLFIELKYSSYYVKAISCFVIYLNYLWLQTLPLWIT